jgi:hypothetical protein
LWLLALGAQKKKKKKKRCTTGKTHFPENVEHFSGIVKHSCVNVSITQQ